MTDTNQKFRALALTALMVLSVFAGTIAFSGAAAAVNRTVNSGGQVFLGEKNVNLAAASGATSYTGVSGPADGGFAQVTSASSADITTANGFQEGGWDASGNGNADFYVSQPKVTDVTLYLTTGGSASDSGADITGGTVPKGDNVTVSADYNFNAAEHAQVKVEDSDGLDVTSQLTSNDLITSNGGNLLLDTSGLSDGTYTVTVEGEDELDSASRQVEFTVGKSSTSISLDKTSVTQGEDVVATINGEPGANETVSVDQSDLVSGMTATDVFASTGDVINRSNENDMASAVVKLGDDGQAKLRIQTDALDDENIATVEVRDGGNASNANTAGDSDDDVDLTVNKRSVSMNAPSNVVIGENFDITGTAKQSDNVYAYVLINDEWQPLIKKGTSGTPASDDTDSSGNYKISVNSSLKINIPDSYQIGVIAMAGNQAPGGGGAVSRSDFSDNVSAKKGLSTQTGSLSVKLSRDRIAKGDTVTVSGTSIGQGDNVRLYIIGPRGNVGFKSASVKSDDTYKADFDGDFTNLAGTGGGTFDTTGTYTVIAVGAGRDGSFSGSQQAGTAAGKLPNEQIAVIEDAYTGAGVDDTMQKATFVGENAAISIDSVGTNNQVEPGNVTVSGTSNREDGTDVFVDVTTQDGKVIGSETATVNGSTQSWSTTVDLSDASTGQTVVVSADDGTVTDSVNVDVVESIQTETPTQTPTETPTETTMAPTTTAAPTTMAPTTTAAPTSAATTTSSGGQPGFGIAIALVALFAAALLALRRRY